MTFLKYGMIEIKASPKELLYKYEGFEELSLRVLKDV
jgi:hypothetical protein